MATSDVQTPVKRDGLGIHLRGHFLLFDKTPESRFDAAIGARLLLIAIGVEALRLLVVAWLRPAVRLWVLVQLLLTLALLLVLFVARLKLSQIGLYRWREWHPSEKSYFIQLLVLANVVF